MKHVKYAMIGCGGMGQEHLCNIALTEGADVTAIYEPDGAMANIAGILAPNARLMHNMSELLQISDIDCIIISSPSYCHVPQLLEIIKTRTIPIFVEAPVFTDIEDADRLSHAVRSYQAPIWVGMQYRYMPPIARFIERAAAVAGPANLLTIKEHGFSFARTADDWNRFNGYSGGTMVDKCCHFFDLMRRVLRDEPVRIFASLGQAIPPPKTTDTDRIPDTDDHGYVIVEFAAGTRAMLELCVFAEGSEFKEIITLVGPNGKISAQVPGPRRFWPPDRGDHPVPQVKESPRGLKGHTQAPVPVPPDLLKAGDHNGATYYQHMRFQAMVRGQLKGPDVSFWDGMAAVLMGQAAQQSSASGAAISLEASKWRIDR